MNWARLFDDHQIAYASRGGNISHGWLGIQCPFCGPDDPSMHMGCHPDGGFSCWRDATHKGRSPVRLVAALLGMSQARASVIVAAYAGASPADFDAPPAVKSGFKAAQTVTLPPEFDVIKKDTLSHKFWLYLRNRGFDNPDDVIQMYNLRSCLIGQYKGRLIIPVNQIGWQARALNPRPDTPRYLTSSADVKSTLFNLDNLHGDTLFVCEGPFDALKVDYYGHHHQARATCLFGVTPTVEQLSLLRQIRSQFSRVVLLFDNDSAALAGMYQVSDWVPGVEFGELPDGVKDPGECSEDQVRRLI